MRRIFWDTMLFVYLLEDDDASTRRVEYLLQTSRERGDLLFTSHLVLAEILTGTKKLGRGNKDRTVREALDEMRFRLLSFEADAVEPFSDLRSKSKVKVADAINLSCAAAAGIDLFLTGDKDLVKLYVPGIKFIMNFDTTAL